MINTGGNDFALSPPLTYCVPYPEYREKTRQDLRDRVEERDCEDEKGDVLPFFHVYSQTLHAHNVPSDNESVMSWNPRNSYYGNSSKTAVLAFDPPPNPFSCPGQRTLVVGEAWLTFSGSSCSFPAPELL